VGFGPRRGVASKAGDFVQQEVSDPCTGRAGEDGMLERGLSSSAAGAGQVWALVEPGGVGS